jgi:YVTN family beta-propeller protein
MRRASVLVLTGLLVGLPAGAAARHGGGTPVALVTAETENQLLAVSLPDGRVLRRVTLPADPENVAADQRVAVVVSTRAGAVSLLDPRSLRVTKTLRGFGAPHMAAIAPAGNWAYVTDDERGQLDVISLTQKRVVNRVTVGIGAHHLAISPDGLRMWIALGEHASTIVVVDLTRPARPRVVSRFHPQLPAHDLAFSPSGRRVWVTSSSATSVAVYDATTARRVFTVPVGAPPQHVAFSSGSRHVRAYLTSGYGSRIESADPSTGRVLRVARVPYGSFNLATLGSYVVTTSLIRGTVTELGPDLRIVKSVRIARAARAVAGVVW